MLPRPGEPTNIILSAKKTCRIGVWNVRTLHAPGHAELLCDELIKYDIPLAILSEVRWKGHGECQISPSRGRDNYCLFYSGGADHSNGVASAIKASYASCVTDFKPVSDRIAVLTISGLVPTTIVVVYAPHDALSTEEKDQFYSDLQGLSTTSQTRTYA